jgi:hypothetical protein
MAWYDTLGEVISRLELHLGVIDDPIKGREEAHRVNARNKAWDWFADDFLSRFAKDAAYHALPRMQRCWLS